MDGNGIQRQREAFAYRVAALEPSESPGPEEQRIASRLRLAYRHINLAYQESASASPLTDDVVYGLSGEFTQWSNDNNKVNPYDESARRGKKRGPIGYWPHIEDFLEERYPAAHRGLQYGFEDAMPLLDEWIPREGETTRGRPYETGEDAIATYGYDPKEIAATMLLLHNNSHPGRDKWVNPDQRRLTDIAQKRFQMQRAYDNRQTVTAAMRLLAAVTQDMVDGLHNEFHEWWGNQKPSGKSVDDFAMSDFMDEERGPIGHWPNVENFLKEKYPAAHKGLGMGLEAEWSLDGHAKPYLTGPEAIKQHGYDPSEIAAGMLLLHNQSDPFRGDMAQQDQDRLNDIAQKRFKMQRAYDSRQPQPAAKPLVNARRRKTAADLVKEYTDGLYNEFHDWAKEQEYVPVGFGKDDPLIANPNYTVPMGGPLTYWDNIEGFLKDKYPAAHRDYRYGEENAADALDGRTLRMPARYSPWPNRSVHPGYETGPEAIEKHGYDPRQVAAGMMYLHTTSHAYGREKLYSRDIDRLSDIFQKRQQMQQDYDNRTAPKELVTANRVVREAMRLMATAPTLPQTGVIEPPQDLSPEDERRVIDEINDHLSYSRPRAAAELWAQSGIPLSNLTRSREIASYIRVWGFPQGIDSEWAQAELDDYTLDNYRRDPSENPLPRNQTSLTDLYAEDNNEGNLGSFEEAFGDDQMEDDEDDQSCPDCDFTTFFDRDMMRHRYIRHSDEDALNEHFGLTPYQPPAPVANPKAPVENTTDPNAKLKSPWYKKVQHYPSGELPSEFSKRRLYDDFNFGEPEIGRDDGQGWYGARPNEGVYQINDSRRPLHKPPVGYVQYEADHDDKTVKIKYLDVHPKKRGQGVATALVSALAEDFPDYKIAPGNTTGHGTGFVNYMQKNAPGAKERLDTDQWNPAPANVLTDDQLDSWGVSQRRSPVFAFIDRHNARVAMRRMRIAAFDQELIDRLRGEYHDWYNEHGDEGLNWAGRGPLGNWRQIENFMKTNYPAAHRGFNAGMETVGDILDHPDLHEGYEGRVYETGPEAVAQHGYDPKEVAAGMLLLHNQTHPQRGDILDADIDRLSDIAQKRSEMQRNYEQRQPQPITAALGLLRTWDRIAGSRIT